MLYFHNILHIKEIIGRIMQHKKSNFLDFQVNGDVTFNDGECKARNLEIDHGYGMALVKQCMTSDSAKHWAGGCNVTYECLQGYDITGPTEFICKDGIWINKNGTRDENLPECKNQFPTSYFKKAFN